MSPISNFWTVSLLGPISQNKLLTGAPMLAQ